MPKGSFMFYNELFTIHPQHVGGLQDCAIWRIPWGIIDRYFGIKVTLK